MRSHSYLNSARDILNAYDGNIPFTAWLKNYFRNNKKFGSTDRKHITHACFSFYRLGGSFQQESTEERILIGLFLCSAHHQLILKELKPDWDDKIEWTPEKKTAYLNAHVELSGIFPFNKHLSPEVSQHSFNHSFLIQPSLFLRIRPGKQKHLIEKLQTAGFTFSRPSENTIELPVGAKMEELFVPDSDVVVQDMNSQKVLTPLEAHIPRDAAFKAWDCCAASGGKSILLLDLFPNALLTVSDVRESILVNLELRFAAAGIDHYRKFVADVARQPPSDGTPYDVIICDAPCSGSGTWSRTPEQLLFFGEEKIKQYTALQKKIVTNATKRMKKGGWFLYITCSVFREENEEVVEFIRRELPFQLIEYRYFKGYEHRADTLFAALFTCG